MIANSIDPTAYANMTDSIVFRFGEVRYIVYQLRTYQHRSASQSYILNQPLFVVLCEGGNDDDDDYGSSYCSQHKYIPDQEQIHHFSVQMNKKQLLAHKYVYSVCSFLYFFLFHSFRLFRFRDRTMLILQCCVSKNLCSINIKCQMLIYIGTMVTPLHRLYDVQRAHICSID